METGFNCSLNGNIEKSIKAENLTYTGDVDNIYTTGYWYLNNASSTAGNMTNMAGSLVAFSNKAGRVVQSYTNIWSGLTFTRVLNSSSWGAWQQLALKSEIAATTVSLGALTANTLTKHQFSITVPSGYKTSAAIHFVIVDGALSNNAIITTQVLPNQTGTATAEVLVYAIGAVSSGGSRLQLYVECVKS